MPELEDSENEDDIDDQSDTAEWRKIIKTKQYTYVYINAYFTAA